ncbi:hypothetical protein [Bacillus cereus]|uniref:hypothetical protein n=1 Tax=Bacillus cereus TaxID=1396 RepID=UPI000BFDE15B|nr:hypothetical protein [Bacillus cereus]PGV23070.1 hypothetical protein COD93_29835 [Bacillus cereus]
MHVIRYISTFACIFLFIFLTMLSTDTDYDVHYEEYIIKSGDTLYDVIKERNKDVTYHWDIRDIVYIAQERNKITNVGSIQHGDLIEVPVLKKEK